MDGVDIGGCISFLMKKHLQDSNSKGVDVGGGGIHDSDRRSSTASTIILVVSTA